MTKGNFKDPCLWRPWLFFLNTTFGQIIRFVFIKVDEKKLVKARKDFYDHATFDAPTVDRLIFISILKKTPYGHFIFSTRISYEFFSQGCGTCLPDHLLSHLLGLWTCPLLFIEHRTSQTFTMMTWLTMMYHKFPRS